MKKYITIVLTATAVFLVSCDPLFNEWFDTETSMSDVKWKCIDGMVTSINFDTTKNAVDPSICVNNGTIYTAWIENGSTIVVKRYNGDEDIPDWQDANYNINTIFTATGTTNSSLVSLNGYLYIGLLDGGTYYVYRLNGTIWENYGTVDTATGNTAVAVYNGSVYTAYPHNAGSIYVFARRCDGPSSWTSIDDIHGSGIGDTGSGSESPALTSDNAALYVAYLELSGFSRLKIRSFNGSSWTTISPGFNYSQTADDDSSEPSVISANGSLYACWRKAFNGDTQRRISAWSFQNGNWNRIDGGMDNGIRYYESNQPLGTVKTGAVNNKLYALWFENSTGAPTDNRLRGKIFNGDTGNPEWRSIDNNMPITYTNDQIISFNTIGYDSKIYIVLTEANGGTNQVHVMAGE